MEKVKLTSELFKDFTESVLQEHKNNKKVYDECIEIYAKTQFFDMSHIKETEKDYICNYNLDNNYIAMSKCENIILNLPFESVFVKNVDDISVFMRDFAPNIITGTFIFPITINSNVHYYKQPFTIKNIFDSMFIEIDCKKFNKMCFDFYGYTIDQNKEMQNKYIDMVTTAIIIIAETFEKISNKTVLIDEPTTNKPKYYRYKDKTKGAIKVNSKPIYIVLDKEKHNKKYDYSNINKQGVLKYDFAFSVIGHWRRLADNNHIGKDKQGIYNIQGYTWVKPFVKGNKDGIMQQKERIVL